jgi:plastocyanin
MRRKTEVQIDVLEKHPKERTAAMRLLLLLPALAISAAAPASTAVPVQTIGLANYRFTPDPISLAAGREVTLKFVNTSTHGHDFTAPEFFAASRIVAGSAPGGKVDLHGGETKAVTLIPTAGEYRAHCAHPFHSALGMHTKIEVR